MVRDIIHDSSFLCLKSQKATKDDKAIAKDLLDTLTHHRENCVGMAANMIGVLKCIICFDDGEKFVTMYNPEIVETSGEYMTEEGCLSYTEGPVRVKRYKSIRVEYLDETFKARSRIYKDFTAQIIQHEIDHLLGVLI